MFRNYTKEDIPAIARIFTDSWRTTYKELLPVELLDSMDYTWSEKYFTDYLKEAGHGAFVSVDDDNQVTGFVTYMPYTEKIPDSLLLDSLHISPLHRGKGIGKKLIYMVGVYAWEQGFQKMVLSLVIGNDRAENIYKHLGAKHLIDYIDYMAEVPYHSRALIWEDVSVFLPEWHY